MTRLTFIKLGGSVITDKTGQQAPDLPVIRRLAAELRRASDIEPGLPIILGHGSGSFGHTAAARYGIQHGIAPGASWHGFAETSAAALRLNRIVVDGLLAAGVPAMALQPSATLETDGGTVARWDSEAIGVALSRRLLPVIHGDVAFDRQRGSAIVSTEALFRHLALHTPLRPAQIILVGEPAVYTADPRLRPDAERIPLITANTIQQVLGGTGDSHGTDVTGGMRSKLELMWSLVEQVPGLQIHLIGADEGLLSATLLGRAGDVGTVIRSGA